MKNFIANGDMIPFVASGAVASGSGLLVGAIFCVASGTYANGEDGVGKTTGVFELPKVGSQAWTVGQAVYWDSANDRCTTVAEDAHFIGVAYAAVGSGADETLGQVRLNGIAGLHTPVAVTNAV
jgi:predicted RecA/RadA family phage recombinase